MAGPVPVPAVVVDQPSRRWTKRTVVSFLEAAVVERYMYSPASATYIVCISYMYSPASII